MSGIKYGDEPNPTFDVSIDSFDGSVGYDSSATTESVGHYLRLNPDQVLDAKNLLLDVDGVARRRGVTKVGAVGAYDIVATTSGAVLAAFRGTTLSSTSVVGPYLATTLPSAGTSANSYVQGTAGAAPTVATQVAVPVSRLACISGQIVSVGRNNSSSTYPNQPYYLNLMSATQRATYNTGTVTPTPGSAVMTGSGTTWTADMEGLYMLLSADNNGYQKSYLVRKVVSATSIILDEPYQGDQSTAGKSYSLMMFATLRAGTKTTCPWGTSSTSVPAARLACEYGNRLVIGWTKENPTAANPPLDAEAPEYKYRLRWSGIIGSQEGYDSNVATSATNNKAIVGMWAWHNNGYLDLNSRFGGLQAMRAFNGALVVWQETGMTVLFGTPVFNGTGSLDATTTYSDIAINGGFAYEETEHGIFFIDKKRGPMVYTGSGKPDALPMSRYIKNTVRAYDHVGYVNDHVIFLNSGIGSATFEAWMFHVPSQRWSRITNSSSFTITHPQRSNDHECCALLENGSGSRVISLDSLTRPDGTVADVDGSTFQVSLMSQHYGDTSVLHRVQEVMATMRYSGTTPTVYAYCYNTMPASQSGQDINPLVTFSTSNPGNANLKTYKKEVTTDAGSAVRVEILGDEALGFFEVTNIRMRGVTEGAVASV